MKIKVTQHHIDTAHCHRCYCPIALAIKEACGIRRNDEKFVQIDTDGSVYFPAICRTVDLSEYAKEAELFIQQYDDWSNCRANRDQRPEDDLPRGGRGSVRPKPFEFELEYENGV